MPQHKCSPLPGSPQIHLRGLCPAHLLPLHPCCHHQHQLEAVVTERQMEQALLILTTLMGSRELCLTDMTAAVVLTLGPTKAIFKDSLQPAVRVAELFLLLLISRAPSAPEGNRGSSRQVLPLCLVSLSIPCQHREGEPGHHCHHSLLPWLEHGRGSSGVPRSPSAGDSGSSRW